MSADDATFLKEFYQALADRPLDPTSHWYVELYADEKLSAADPVEALATGIEWSPGCSVQLFSGFRGTGKSTELRRLKALLKSRGYAVVLCDMQKYVNLTTPVDVSDFLIAVAGALSEAFAEDELLLGSNVAKEGYWTRFANWMIRTNVDLDEVKLGAKTPDGAAAEIKLNLKQDPSFREVLQKRLRGHIGSLTADVHAFVEDCVKAVRARHPDLEIVLLLDSIEQIRGTSVNATDVYASVDTLFQGHADKLRLPNLHVVYTVPPWLKVRAQGIGGLYSGFQMVPCVKIRARAGDAFPEGLDALARLVALRGDWARVFGDRERLDRVLTASGGYLRDLFRLVQRCLVHARGRALPLEDRVVDLAIAEIRNDYLPIAHNDAAWLLRVAESGTAELADGRQLADLARLFETHLVLCYRNGGEWFGVHPLVREQVEELATRTEPPKTAPPASPAE